jgi:hypothetical protein
MQQDVGRPRRLRRREVAHDAVKAEQRLDEVAREVPVEDIRRAAHREVVNDPSFGQRQSRHVATQAEQLGDRADLAPDVGGRAQQPFLEQSHDRLEFSQVAIIGFRVGLMVAGDFLARQAAATRQQIVAIAGQEIVGLPEDDLQPMPLQLHVADHLRLKQADGVTRCRISETGQEFISDRGAANGSGRFEHGDLEAPLRQIISAGQAVVAGADDDRVVQLSPWRSGI